MARGDALWRQACIALRVGGYALIGGIVLFIATDYQQLWLARLGTAVFCLACLWLMMLEAYRWRQQKR